MKKLSLALVAVLIGLWLVVKNNNDKSALTKPSTPEKRPAQPKKVSSEKIEKTSQKMAKKVPSRPSKLENKKEVQAPSQRDFAYDQHPVTEKGELLVSQILVVDEYAVAHGDILVGSYDEVLEMERKGEFPKIKKPTKWENALVPYSISRDYPEPERIERVLEYIGQNTPVQFIERSREHENYVLFELGEEHCFSSLGQQGGEQKIVLTLNCAEKEIAHEVMHALGFLHEQNRKDRDQHIKIHWDNVKEDYTEQFKKIPEAILPVERTPFDFKSTMLYPPFAFALSPSLPTITTRDGDVYQNGQSWLSQGDLEKIKTFYSRD